MTFPLPAKIALVIAVPTAAFIIYLLFKPDDDDYDDYHPIATSKQSVVEVKVPCDYVGAVIGRSGANIKDIAEKTGARVDFAQKEQKNSDAEYRIAKIRGTQEATQKAEMMIHQILADSKRHTIRVTVRVKCIGRIIGKNGENIRRMQRISGARITIDSGGDESNPENPKDIIVVGSLSQIESAKEMIEEKVKMDEVFRAKVNVTTANREARKKLENVDERGDKTKTDPEISERVPESIVSCDVVTKEQWNETPDLKPQKQFIEVYVSAVVDPSDFYVQIINSNCFQFDDLVRRMTSMYSALQKQNDKSLIPESIKEGDFVAAPFEHDDSWYRAQVESTNDDKVNLFYVDYGDRGALQSDHVMTLDDSFYGLPHQAIHCRLANVEPTDGQWTPEAIDLFENLTHCAEWKAIMAQTVSYCPGTIDPIPCLHLVDTSSEDDVDVNSELIKAGHATSEENSQTNPTCNGILPTDNISETTKETVDHSHVETDDSFDIHDDLEITTSDINITDNIEDSNITE